MCKLLVVGYTQCAHVAWDEGLIRCEASSAKDKKDACNFVKDGKPETLWHLKPVEGMCFFCKIDSEGRLADNMDNADERRRRA
ncbi:hypothetical protein NX059_005869 [Plenodomus lindquistii]|nr:hypothetical protein NX059_005869 [Plenodomus lindquistii]